MGYIKVVALADLFEDRLDRTRGELAKLGIDIARNRCFTGFDAYNRLLEIPEINYVILATPPHFQPVHLKAAIEAGKNAFIEKPAAVDVPGVHLVAEGWGTFSQRRADQVQTASIGVRWSRLKRKERGQVHAAECPASVRGLARTPNLPIS